jgi:hypothetical protein
MKNDNVENYPKVKDEYLKRLEKLRKLDTIEIGNIHLFKKRYQ